MNLIVRGDLRSEFGAARHLRDQVHLFSVFFTKIYGIDLHYHPRFDRAHFPFEIISELDAKSLIEDNSETDWIVLHHVTPDYFTRFPKCYNLGYFVWETDKQPENSNWELLFQQLDGLWVSTDFLVCVARNLGWQKDIHVIPWPMTKMDVKVKVSSLEKLQIYRVSSVGISKISLMDFNQSKSEFFFSVASDAPRKALPVLLSEWVGYKKRSKMRRSLVLKISTFNFSKMEQSLLKECKQLLEFACGGKTLTETDLVVITDNLSENELAYFYESSLAYITTTVGEGFGGPIAESALLGKAVLSPRHSSLKSLIPEDYPFILPHEMVTLGQGPNSFYSPSSKWGLINAGALTDKLIHLDSMSYDDVSFWGEPLKNYVYDACNPEKVKVSMEAFLKSQKNAIKSKNLTG